MLLNPSWLLKGGTLVLLSKRAPISVLHSEMDDDGRILFVSISYLGLVLPLLSVYAPSGSARQQEGVFFATEVLHFLRHDTRSMFFWGISTVLRRSWTVVVFCLLMCLLLWLKLWGEELVETQL